MEFKYLEICYVIHWIEERIYNKCTLHVSASPFFLWNVKESLN